MIQLAPPKIRYARQIAALPWRVDDDGNLQFLLVTSRISKHWLIPKGWPMTGKSDAQSALQEAFEEAGIKGTARSRPLGRYSYDKILKDGTVIPCSVKVFGMRVREELDDWPEMHQRERRWFAPAAAADAVTEHGLADFLRSLERPASVASKLGVGRIVA
jgi:8-oxo-dGTP pyrophosphatase MutT (NUDIX family)